MARSPEHLLSDDRVHAPITVGDLGYAEIDTERDQRHRLVLAQPIMLHQKLARRPERVAQCEIDRRLLVNLGLRIPPQLAQIVAVAKAVQDPLVWGFQQRIGQALEEWLRALVLLVQHQAELPGKREFQRSAIDLAVTLREVRIAHREKRARNGHRKI